ncbi:MAG: YebC/PmpR family DNA-binding transcriptional regulator [Candidatus Harrisonbacteria bacterium]|nr:YebC/PmpR family DNA-binding transcriptional regulator [Candidatus Harrisonbacteria bacterium]
MSGHNKWSKIKHKKAATDTKKSKLFSKHIAAISVAARENADPTANPTLRAAIERAKADKVPMTNIENALNKSLQQKNLVDLIVEAYGPEGEAILILALTDSSNRTIAELKKLLSDLGAKFADPGSVLWAFEKGEEGWRAKFPQSGSSASREKLDAIVSSLEEQRDVQAVYTNIQ